VDAKNAVGGEMFEKTLINRIIAERRQWTALLHPPVSLRSSRKLVPDSPVKRVSRPQVASPRIPPAPTYAILPQAPLELCVARVVKPECVVGNMTVSLDLCPFPHHLEADLEGRLAR
jgi:hypothetical protein